MKIIKSRLIGTHGIKAKDPNIQLFQIRMLLNQHRDALVERILSDLATYIEYKFKTQPSRNNLQLIFEKLLAFKTKDVDLEYYEPLLKQLHRKDELQFTNDCFFMEIDEQIRMNLNRQLNFAA
jgi:hypothetical protein